MRKSKVRIEGACFGGFHLPKHGNMGGVIERHADVEIHFESLYAWLSFLYTHADRRHRHVGFNGSCASLHSGAFARSIVANGERRDKIRHKGKSGGAVGYTLSPVYGADPFAVVRQGCRDLRNAKHNGGLRCEHCDWSGPSLNLVPHQCERTYFVMKNGVNECVRERYPQHDLKYRAELVDEFGRLVSPDDIDEALLWLRNERAQKTKERTLTKLAQEGWDVSQYCFDRRGSDCQPQNRGRLPHDGFGRYGTFLRKYPEVLSYDTFYNYRRMRTTQELRLIAATECEDDAPKIRAKRRYASLSSCGDDVCGTLQRSWKVAKKRKQWQ